MLGGEPAAEDATGGMGKVVLVTAGAGPGLLDFCATADGVVSAFEGFAALAEEAGAGIAGFCPATDGDDVASAGVFTAEAGSGSDCFSATGDDGNPELVGFVSAPEAESGIGGFSAGERTFPVAALGTAGSDFALAASPFAVDVSERALACFAAAVAFDFSARRAASAFWWGGCRTIR
jgi:hypothetical protein